MHPIDALTLPRVDLIRDSDIFIELLHLCWRDDEALLWLIVLDLHIHVSLTYDAIRSNGLPNAAQDHEETLQDVVEVDLLDQKDAATSSRWV
jgi:hypothetical protein